MLVNRLILGCFLTLILVGVGMFWWQGRAQVEEGAPPPMVQETPNQTGEPELPEVVDPSLRGPAPPEATELSREQRRFFRYDRNRDQIISRNEMLSTRTKAFQKLDKDGNNLLSFEEWAVATATKFDTADTNRDRALTAAEFAITRPKKKIKPACRC